MLTNSFRQLLIFGALYCATQGALDSWDEAIELLYLSSYKVDVSSIALAQTLGVLPMAIKSILSIPSDITRLRKPFIAFGLVLAGSMFIIKTTFNTNTSFWAYCLCLMLRNTGAAISDGAVDGLTIDADVDALSGTISAWQGVGRMLGLMISTSVTGQLASDNTNSAYNNVLTFLGIWMLASFPVAFIVKEELAPTVLGNKLIRGYNVVMNIITCGGRLTHVIQVIFGPLYRQIKRTVQSLMNHISSYYSSLPVSKSLPHISIKDFGFNGKSSIDSTVTYTSASTTTTTIVENALHNLNKSVQVPTDTPLLVSPTTEPQTSSSSSSLSNANLPISSRSTTESSTEDESTILKSASTGSYTTTSSLSLIPPSSLAPAVPFDSSSSSSSSTTVGNRQQRIQNLLKATNAPDLNIKNPSDNNSNKYLDDINDDTITMQSSTLSSSKFSTDSSLSSSSSTVASPPLSPLPAPSQALDTKDAFMLLLRHVQRTPVAAFVCFMYMGQFATYIASFPVVLWLSENRGFSVADVGLLTVIGSFGNAAGCYLFGMLFDIIPVKRLALLIATLLSGLPYLLFTYSQNFAEVTAVWTLCGVGYGALYTVQVSQMRLLADKSVAASYSGLCMGMLAIAAAVGTTLGGVISGTEGWNYETCYTAGAITSGLATVFIPWITAEDPEIIAFKQKQRRERERLLQGKKRRRSSFRQWISRVRGVDAALEMEYEDKEYDTAAVGLLLSPITNLPIDTTGMDPSLSPLALSPFFNAVVSPSSPTLSNDTTSRSMDDLRRQAVVNQLSTKKVFPGTSTTERRTLRRPALGSMKNLLDIQSYESESSFSVRLRRNVRQLFDDSSVAVRRFSNTVIRRTSSVRNRSTEWGTTTGSSTSSSTFSLSPAAISTGNSVANDTATTTVMNVMNTALPSYNYSTTSDNTFTIDDSTNGDLPIEIIPVDDHNVSFD